MVSHPIFTNLQRWNSSIYLQVTSQGYTNDRQSHLTLQARLKYSQIMTYAEFSYGELEERGLILKLQGAEHRHRHAGGSVPTSSSTSSSAPLSADGKKSITHKGLCIFVKTVH